MHCLAHPLVPQPHKVPCTQIDDGTDRYGICDDCPAFKGLWDYCRVVVGGTLTAVRCLAAGSKCAVHLGGGRHHASRAVAAGFCYVNDVVLGAMALRAAFGRVLVVDVDIHHGDGTEAAFVGDPSTVTLSLHKFAPGYFPGTGGPGTTSAAAGVVNVPLGAGVSDSTFTAAFDAALAATWSAYPPAAVLLVCGVDGLARDPSQGGNLTHAAFQHVIQALLHKCGTHARPKLPMSKPAVPSFNAPDKPSDGFAMPAPRVQRTAPSVAAHIPLLVLGGGGYAPGPSAVALGHVVAACAGQVLPSRVPEHEFLGMYVRASRSHPMCCSLQPQTTFHPQVRPDIPNYSRCTEH